MNKRREVLALSRPAVLSALQKGIDSSLSLHPITRLLQVINNLIAVS